jgi:choline kinase
MAELHCVDIEAIEETSPATRGEGKGWEIGAKKNVKAWLAPAREVLALPAVTETSRRDLDLDVFMELWEKYMRWLKEFEKTQGASRRVFAHNDAQYGNLLRLERIKEGLPEHHQVIVVDFEYASPNPAAFDIANHFHEWTADYHSPTPHILDPTRYPSPQERRNFYVAYLAQSIVSSSAPPEALEKDIPEKELEKLDRQVRAWSPASHAMWAVWGIVQAKEDMEGKEGEPEFDYIGYARCRVEGFCQEISSLGI